MLQIPDLSKDEAIIHFLRGLKDNIREQVNNRNPIDIEQAMAYAQQADLNYKFGDRLSSMGARRGGRGGQQQRYTMERSWGYSGGGRGPVRGWSSQQQIVGGSSDSAVPMELGARGTDGEWDENPNPFNTDSEDQSNEAYENDRSNMQLNAIGGQRGGRMNYGRGGGRTGGRPSPFLPSEEYQRCRAENRCFACGQPGHRRIDCRQNNGRSGTGGLRPTISKNEKTSKPSSEISTADDCWGV